MVGVEADKKPATPCIRCAECAVVCPVNLLPQELHSAAASRELDTAERYSVDRCILCGCCDIVCPANIPLTSWFRHTKQALMQQRQDESNAEQARILYDKREKRINERAAMKAAKEAKRRQTTTQNSSAQDDIKAALARAKAKRSAK